MLNLEVTHTFYLKHN